MIDEYYMDMFGQVVRTDNDFLCCNRCKSIELTMDTTTMSHGLVFDKDGVIVKYNCNSCGANLILALFNDNVGKSQLTARINWVTDH
jgi:hypothetical protein